jgi:hypothetical protein
MFGQSKTMKNLYIMIEPSITQNSYIDDFGTGILNIRSSSSIKLRTMLNEDYLIATEGSSVDLYYDNIKKFETTPTGINVTGTIQADNLTMLDKLISQRLNQCQ